MADRADRQEWSRERGWQDSGPRSPVVPFALAVGVLSVTELVVGGLASILAAVVGEGDGGNTAVNLLAGVSVTLAAVVGFAVWMERPASLENGAVAELPDDFVPGSLATAVRGQLFWVGLLVVLAAMLLVLGGAFPGWFLVAAGASGLLAASILQSRDARRGWALFVNAKGGWLTERPYCFKGRVRA